MVSFIMDNPQLRVGCRSTWKMFIKETGSKRSYESLRARAGYAGFEEDVNAMRSTVHVHDSHHIAAATAATLLPIHLQSDCLNEVSNSINNSKHHNQKGTELELMIGESSNMLEVRTVSSCVSDEPCLPVESRSRSKTFIEGRRGRKSERLRQPYSSLDHQDGSKADIKSHDLVPREFISAPSSNLPLQRYNFRHQSRRKSRVDKGPFLLPILKADVANCADCCKSADFSQLHESMSMTAIDKKRKNRSSHKATLEQTLAVDGAAQEGNDCRKVNLSSQSSHETIFQDNCCCS
jgi:hypothetical protein